MPESVIWITTFLCILGNILVIYKKRIGFALWCVTNVVFVTYSLLTSQYHMAMLWLVYLGLATWGFIKWKGSERINLICGACHSRLGYYKTSEIGTGREVYKALGCNRCCSDCMKFRKSLLKPDRY